VFGANRIKEEREGWLTYIVIIAIGAKMIFGHSDSISREEDIGGDGLTIQFRVF
jgi:hypothetical protein